MSPNNAIHRRFVDIEDRKPLKRAPADEVVQLVTTSTTVQPTELGEALTMWFPIAPNPMKPMVLVLSSSTLELDILAGFT